MTGRKKQENSLVVIITLHKAHPELLDLLMREGKKEHVSFQLPHENQMIPNIYQFKDF